MRTLLALLLTLCVAFSTVDAQSGSRNRQSGRALSRLRQKVEQGVDKAGDGTRKLTRKIRDFLRGDSPQNRDAETPASRRKLSDYAGTGSNSQLQRHEQNYEASLARGDYASALYYLQLYETARDSLVVTRLEADKAQQEAALAQQEAARQEIVSYSTGGGALLMMALAGLLFVGFRQKKRSNLILSQMNGELQSANSEIKAQKVVLERQHQDILDSITYARRIQEAVLPAMQQISASLPQSFVLYRPKDIVSGDFFWFHRAKGRTFIAAVDCTGHGVPGAFMSMLGMSLLSQIVAEDAELEPGEMLNRLHAGVIRSLKQQEQATNQDGMDITLCVLESDGRTLRVAAANNPLYLVRGGALEEVSPDKAPIGGIRYADHRFTTHSLELSSGDTLYLFSDGYADQFGGPKGKKYTYRRLRERLLELQPKSLPEQGAEMGKEFGEWLGTQEQTDDVLLIGVRI